ncbi:tRNA guanosine(34) transglycosylase Tgt [Candidatus Eisenbacteria bacterium]|uniref:Queuine tRNA-ribosyltransferase n=1 Tax=Eiseniibacteriota bacterium TaxID=2212470 RepID=A0ABV6YJF5_UNCEI
MRERRAVKFELLHGGRRGPRLGRLQIGAIEVPTPAFMPVGTRASVKTLGCEDLEEIGAKLILANTYHLHLRPGADLIQRRGGLHRFMSWEGGILTDSGGFQVHSLAGLRRILPEGVEFRSHLDGSRHLFTPERTVEIQAALGSDIHMVLDVCTTYPAEERQAAAEMETTLRWAERSKRQREQMLSSGAPVGALFGIVQGGLYPRLRQRCARELASLGFDGYALGGLSVGEPASQRPAVMDATLETLPAEDPRYLMGVGTPADILDAVGRGVDLFDCVLPSRNARKGTVFTWDGKMVVKNRVYAEDDTPIDAECGCCACRRYSRAYLRHLFQVGEYLGGRLATIHSLAFYQQLMERIRQAIAEEQFSSFAAATLSRMGVGAVE